MDKFLLVSSELEISLTKKTMSSQSFFLNKLAKSPFSDDHILCFIYTVLIFHVFPLSF